MKKIAFSIALAFGISLAGFSQPAEGYYDGLDGKSGADLFNAISSAACVGYKSLGYDGLFDAYPETDAKSDGTVWDMYSDCEFSMSKTCGNYSNECDCYNREHSIPQSWWGSGTSNQGCDIFHVLPTDGKVNGMRSNYPYGEVASATYTSANGSKKGSSKLSSYSGVVFEPIDEYKGDIARGILGTMTKWKGKWTSGNGGAVFNGTYTSASNYGLTDYGVEVLVKWHRQDPVSQKELDRNDAIQNTQGNRNPFIDYPCLVEYLWGDKKDEELTLSTLMSAYDDNYFSSDQTGCTCSTEPAITKPKGDVNVGVTELNKAISANVAVRGTMLTAPVYLELSGENADMFTIDKTSIPAATAITGTIVKVTYTPTTLAAHQATLTLTSAGANTVSIVLSGSVAMPHTVTFDAGAGTCSVSRLMESSINAGVVLPEATLSSSCSSEGWEFAGWCTTKLDETTDKPELLAKATTYYPTADCTLYAVYSKTEGEKPELTSVKLTAAKFDMAAKYAEYECTEGDYTFVVNQGYLQGSDIQMNAGKGNGILYNTDEMVLQSIDLTVDGTSNSYTVYEGTYAQPATQLGTASATKSFTFSDQQTYFKISVAGCVKFSSIVVNYYTNNNIVTYSNELECSQTAVSEISANDALYFVSGNQLCVVDLQQGTTLALYDCIGRVVEQRTNCSTNETFTLNKGVYILKIKSDKNEQSIKIIY